MTIDLLDTPLRMTWDLHGKLGTLGTEEVRRIADELSAAGVFFVTLEERPLLHPGIREILNILTVGGCQPLLVCDGLAEEFSRLPEVQWAGGLFLNARTFFKAGRPDLTALSRAVDSLRRMGFDPALLLTPLRDNIHAVPDLLEFCRLSGIGKFKLPNVKIGDSFRPSMRTALLRPKDLEKFKSLLGDDPDALRGEVALEVHDLFLWELLLPGHADGRSEYGGCQAGNSLGHIDEAGFLYPCSSFPVKLGSLLHNSLEELWQVPGRFQIRDGVGAVPQGCSGCRDYPICFGGCRGLASFLSREAGGRDPLCSGPR